MIDDDLESLVDVAGELHEELGPVASYLRTYRAGITHRLFVRRGRAWFVPPENKARLKIAVLALSPAESGMRGHVRRHGPARGRIGGARPQRRHRRHK